MGCLFFIIEEITVLGVCACGPVVGDADVEVPFAKTLRVAEGEVELLWVVLVEAGITEGGEGEPFPRDACLRLDADTTHVDTTPHIMTDKVGMDVGLEVTLFYQFYLRCFLFFLCQSRCRQQGDGHQGQ